MEAEISFSTKPNDSNDLRNIFNQWHGGCYRETNIAVGVSVKDVIRSLFVPRSAARLEVPARLVAQKRCEA